MKRNDRTKDELAQSLVEMANEIFSLEEFPVIPKNATLKEKLDAHSSRWRTRFNEFVAESFLFAKKFHYSADFFRQNDISDEKDDSVNKEERLVSLYSEDLMKVSYRMFAKKSDKSATDFISFFEASIREEFKHSMCKNERIEKNQGIGIPEKKQRIYSDYNRVKTAVQMCAKNRKDLTESRIQEIYISTSNHYRITIEKLRKIILEISNASVLLESDTIRNSDEEDLTVTIFDSLTGADSVENDLSDKVKIDEIAQKLLTLDEAYSCAQERTKPYLSALLTRQALEEFSSANVDYKTYFEYLNDKAFFTTRKASMVKELFLKYKKCPPQQEVAEWFGRDKTDASRTLRNFLKKSGHTTS